MNFIKKDFAYIAIATVVFAVGIFVILPAAPSADQAKDTFVSMASAWGDSGCGDCGGGTGGGGNDDSEDGCDRNPTRPNCGGTPAVCDFLRATPDSVPNGGGSVRLEWGTTNANIVEIDNGVGKVNPNGNKTVNVNSATTYTLTAYKNEIFKVFGRGDTCVVSIDIAEPTPAKCLAFAASPTRLPAGGGATKLTWSTENATKVELRNVTTATQNPVAKNNTTGRSENISRDTEFQLIVTGADGSVDNSCRVSIDLETPTPDAKCLAFNADPTNLPAGGGTTNLTWSTENATKVELKNETTGAKNQIAANNSTGRPENITQDTIFRLIVTGANSKVDDSCVVRIDVADATPDPLCKSFTAEPESFNNGTGGTVTLNWETVNLISASINQGIGPVNLQGPTSTVLALTNVTAPVTTTYTLTGIAAGGRSVTCSDSVIVNPANTPDPITCPANVDFKATPTNLGVGGGDVKLTWSTTKIKSVKLDGIVQDLNGSTTVSITANKTFNLEVVGDNTTAGNVEICPLPVTVSDPQEFSCAKNVTFSASNRNLPRGGGDVTFNWNTTGLDSLSITSLASTNLSGSETIRVTSDKTFTLTGKKAGFADIHCPVSIDVATGGGGGGGSARPRCEFLASDKSISSGQEITLSWETNRGRDIAIYEGTKRSGEKIFSTNDDDLVDEGEIKVKPTKDTTYTLVVARGSSERNCDVDIKVKDAVVIKSVRNQGQVAGISLTAVPYTGFDAGPTLTAIFYAVLAIWGLFIAYMLVIREDTILGVSLAGAYPRNKVIHEDLSSDEIAGDEKTSEAAAYVGSVIAPITPITSTAAQTASIPSNLPTGSAPTIGYASAVKAATADIETDEDAVSLEMKELEDRAHESKVLLSSDAMRHLIATCPKDINRVVFLDQIVTEAKVSYPSEDGWVVLNLDRMQELCEKQIATLPVTEKVEVAEDKKVNVSPVTDTNGSSSLAEAIATGNIAAAYQMLGNRPMFALADAAADLDAVYRGRRGEQVVVSNLLASESAKFDTEQIRAAIDALTSAIDGTYDDEASAVKMAIIKATKALS